MGEPWVILRALLWVCVGQHHASSFALAGRSSKRGRYINFTLKKSCPWSRSVKDDAVIYCKNIFLSIRSSSSPSAIWSKYRQRKILTEKKIKKLSSVDQSAFDVLLMQKQWNLSKTNHVKEVKTNRAQKSQFWRRTAFARNVQYLFSKNPTKELFLEMCSSKEINYECFYPTFLFSLQFGTFFNIYSLLWCPVSSIIVLAEKFLAAVGKWQRFLATGQRQNLTTFLLADPASCFGAAGHPFVIITAFVGAFCKNLMAKLSFPLGLLFIEFSSSEDSGHWI